MFLDPDRFGPFAEPYLVIGPTDRVPPLPCPVVAVGAQAHPNADVTVADERGLEQVLAAIVAAPIAACTLAQVLRAGEGLPLWDALVVESLAYATLQNGAENRAWLAGREPPPPVPEEAGPAVLVAREGGVLGLTLNRPAGRNALSVEVRDGLVAALRLAALDAGVATIELRGAGRCFSVGGALSEFGLAPDQATAHAVRCMRGPAFALAPVAGRVRAVVQGACIGAGAELASLCGHVSAQRCSFFQLPELRMGLIPGAGGTAGFSRRIGRQRTAWLALTGRRIGAKQALAWGLIDAIHAGGGDAHLADP